MNTKLTTRWILIGLLCALIFGGIGYMYGSYLTSIQCDELLSTQSESICSSFPIDKGLQTDSTDTRTISQKIIENAVKS